MLKDFKSFIARGNVVDLAVGVIIGAAFGKVVSSLVEDIVMPPIGLVLGNVDFKDLFIPLGDQRFATLAEARKASAPVLAYGNFLNTVISFLIVALAVYLLVLQVRRLLPAPEVAPVTPQRPCPECTTPIALAARRCPACTTVLAGT